MLGNERQRAYRYGMTLLCVGVFFNWLSITENNSEPVRFVGFTCLASGAILVCMAICLWANSTRQHNSQVRPERNGSTLNSLDTQRETSQTIEKPPDYETVADTTAPPSYADAILLSPAYLNPSSPIPGAEPQTEVSIPSAAVVDVQPATDVTPSTEVNIEATNVETELGNKPPEIAQPEPSRLTRVLRLSRRLIRRTLSNVEATDIEASRNPNLIRSTSVQDNKPA